MSPMGGKRHKGVGYNRAKKKRVSWCLPRASSSAIDSESDGDSDDETDPLLEAPQPPPPMPPAEAVEAVEPQGGAETSSLRKHMRLAKAATTKAKGLVAKKLRRWYKAKKTYITSGKSLASTPTSTPAAL